MTSHGSLEGADVRFYAPSTSTLVRTEHTLAMITPAHCVFKVVSVLGMLFDDAQFWRLMLRGLGAGMADEILAGETQHTKTPRGPVRWRVYSTLERKGRRSPPSLCGVHTYRVSNEHRGLVVHTEFIHEGDHDVVAGMLVTMMERASVDLFRPSREPL